MRIRTIKPGFFLHDRLFDAEVASGLPLRLAYIGLWCAADREGRFAWEPRRLGAVILPYDGIDFSRVLGALIDGRWVIRYEVAGREYGEIPSFPRHQVINNRERESEIPPAPPPLVQDRDACPTRASRVTEKIVTPLVQDRDASCAGESRVSEKIVTPLVHAQGEGKGREGNMEGEKEKLSLPPRAREPEPAPTASAWGKPRPSPNPIQRPQAPAPKSEPADDLRTPPEDAQAARRERWSKRRKAWLDERGEAVDFTVQPGPLTWLSYCKAVHPSWQDGPARKAYDTLATYGWKQGGRRIESWWQVADAWAENSDHSEHYEKLPIGSMAAGAGLSEAMSAAAAGITGGEGFS